MLRVQVHIVGSFLFCRDFKHCAQSGFDKLTGVLGGSLLAVENEQTVRVWPTYIPILQIKNSSRIFHETMSSILTGSLMGESLFSVVNYVMLH